MNNCFNATRILFRKSSSYTRIANVLSMQPGNKGWIQRVRNLKEHFFADLNDGSSVKSLQLVIPKSLKNENIKVNYGQSISATGSLAISPNKNLEISVEDLVILGKCDVTEGYPFSAKQKHPYEYLREHLHLRPRTLEFGSILRTRHRVVKEIHDYFDKLGCVNIQTPILTSNDCEGAGEVFFVRPDSQKLLNHMNKIINQPAEEIFFNKKVFLTVSGQFHLESMTHGLGDTYCLNPAFRAENAKSLHHLSEFTMLEAELASIDNIKKLTDFVEDMLKSISKNVLEICQHDLSALTNGQEKFNNSWLEEKWPVITYDQAFDLLEKNEENFKSKPNKEKGPSKEHELFLADHFKSPLFLTEWPKAIKPFYMKQNQTDSTKVDAFDLLVPNVGEIAGGSLRENNFEILCKNIPEELNWYLDLRKYGSIPTGGFGLGLERYLQLITGVRNIRDLVSFPRWAHNCGM